MERPAVSAAITSMRTYKTDAAIRDPLNRKSRGTRQVRCNRRISGEACRDNGITEKPRQARRHEHSLGRHMIHAVSVRAA